MALTGASGSYAAKAIVERSKWPVTLIASKMSEWSMNKKQVLSKS